MGILLFADPAELQERGLLAWSEEDFAVGLLRVVFGPFFDLLFADLELPHDRPEVELVFAEPVGEFTVSGG